MPHHVVMKSEQRIVTEMPLAEVWNDEGVVGAKRTTFLNAEDIKALLGHRRVRFIIANPGLKLRWIAEDRCFEFWKSEVKAHLADPREEGHRLEGFPGGYFYIASRWEGEGIDPPIILLEKHH